MIKKISNFIEYTKCSLALIISKVGTITSQINEILQLLKKEKSNYYIGDEYIQSEQFLSKMEELINTDVAIGQSLFKTPDDKHSYMGRCVGYGVSIINSYKGELIIETVRYVVIKNKDGVIETVRLDEKDMVISVLTTKLVDSQS